jgi:hypothetical protein
MVSIYYGTDHDPGIEINGGFYNYSGLHMLGMTPVANCKVVNIKEIALPDTFRLVLKSFVRHSRIYSFA